MKNKLVLEKARILATISHKGQYRFNGKTPYIEHPMAVVKLLEEIGIVDEEIICAAWLHDTIEDCGLTKESIEKEFNANIAQIVQTLTRDVNRDLYKQKIKSADYAVQIIKLADVLHNCSTLSKLSPRHMIKTKVNDCKDFYLSLAKQICPEFYHLLVKYICSLERLI